MVLFSQKNPFHTEFVLLKKKLERTPANLQDIKLGIFNEERHVLPENLAENLSKKDFTKFVTIFSSETGCPAGTVTKKTVQHGRFEKMISRLQSRLDNFIVEVSTKEKTLSKNTRLKTVYKQFSYTVRKQHYTAFHLYLKDSNLAELLVEAFEGAKHSTHVACPPLYVFVPEFLDRLLMPIVLSPEYRQENVEKVVDKRLLSFFVSKLLACIFSTSTTEKVGFFIEKNIFFSSTEESRYGQNHPFLANCIDLRLEKKMSEFVSNKYMRRPLLSQAVPYKKLSTDNMSNYFRESYQYDQPVIELLSEPNYNEGDHGIAFHENSMYIAAIRKLESTPVILDAKILRDFFDSIYVPQLEQFAHICVNTNMTHAQANEVFDQTLALGLGLPATKDQIRCWLEVRYSNLPDQNKLSGVELEKRVLDVAMKYVLFRQQAWDVFTLNNNPTFFKAKVCFRGRIYITSLLSPMFHKFVRRLVRFPGPAMLDNVEFKTTLIKLRSKYPTVDKIIIHQDLQEIAKIQNVKDRLTIFFKTMHYHFNGTVHTHSDATASALQIMGLITNQVDLLRATNFGSESTKLDPYMEILPTELQIADNCGNITFVPKEKLDRNIIKKIIMQFFYGQNAHSMAAEFAADPETSKFCLEGIELHGYALFYELATKVVAAVDCKTNNASSKQRKMFNKLCVKGKYTLNVYFPGECEVKSVYYTPKQQQITFSVKEDTPEVDNSTTSSHKIRLAENGDVINKAKSRRAFIPNLYHVFDAWLNAWVITHTKGPVLSLHDAWIHPSGSHNEITSCYAAGAVVLQKVVWELFYDDLIRENFEAPNAKSIALIQTSAFCLAAE